MILVPLFNVQFMKFYPAKFLALIVFLLTPLITVGHGLSLLALAEVPAIRLEAP